jgi:parallel beta-helix repeat protein
MGWGSRWHVFERGERMSGSSEVPAVVGTRVRLLGLLAGLGLFIAVAPADLAAATNCVNPGGTGGCYSTIGAAVAASSAGDTIRVAHGTYTEDVVIGIPLSLIGDGAERTVIDATGLPNGVSIDGYNHPGLSHVVVSGFTVRNANFQGILVTDSSFVTVADNIVTGNDVSLQPFAQGGPVCPGLPAYFVAGEGFDCGEGIHLSGVTYSAVAGNILHDNAGGILLSDDTGASHDNLISGNLVRYNPYDCGITIASHHFELALNPSYGVYHNTITENVSSSNGLSTGEGAGVGLFAGPPGAQTWGNVVSDNTLNDNALPGVTMHSHTPFQKLNDNLIVGNRISGNGPDPDPGTTVPTGIDVFADEAHGAAPITGTVISQNVIRNEGIDIAVATSGGVDAHLNSLFRPVGIDNLGSGSVNATENWWQCFHGPGTNGCSGVTGTGVDSTPWLTEPFSGINGGF